MHYKCIIDGNPRKVKSHREKSAGQNPLSVPWKRILSSDIEPRRALGWQRLTSTLTDLTDAARDSLGRSGLLAELGEGKVKLSVGEAVERQI
jgi:hypothetical protein